MRWSTMLDFEGPLPAEVSVGAGSFAAAGRCYRPSGCFVPLT